MDLRPAASRHSASRIPAAPYTFPPNSIKMGVDLAALNTYLADKTYIEG